MGQQNLNLKNVTGLLADRDPFTRGLIAQMLRGFRINTLLIASNGEEAKKLLLDNTTDICFVEAVLPDMSASDLIGWIRRQTPKPLRFVPVIVLSGYTQMRTISAARDGGAHAVIRKPVSPQILYDRISWAARFSRPFIEARSFTGPDRRFHDIAPPDGKLKRETDVETDLGPDSLAKAE